MWIPLMEFAVKKGVSLSTLRRHIKANKVLYKVENGRYLLHDADAEVESAASSMTAGEAPRSLRAIPVKSRNAAGATAPVAATDSEGNAKLRKLEIELQRAREENAELKTLIAFYEEQVALGRRISN